MSPTPIENVTRAVEAYLRTLTADGWVIVGVEINAVVKNPLTEISVSLDREEVGR